MTSETIKAGAEAIAKVVDEKGWYDWEPMSTAALRAFLQSEVMREIREALEFYREHCQPDGGKIAHIALAKLAELEKELGDG